MGGFRPPQLTYEDLEALATTLENVNGVTAEQTTTQNVKTDYAGTLEDISIMGVTADFPAVHALEVGDGRFFTTKENDEASKLAVLGSEMATELFGDASPIGQQVTVGSSVRFTVIGVMAEHGSVGGTDYDSRIYVPIRVVFKRFNFARFGGDAVRMIYVSAASSEVMNDVMAQITELLIERHEVDPASPDFSMMTQSSIIDTQASTTETFRSLLAWVAGVSLVVGGIGIMNIMLVSVTERTREIGLRQALGARPWDVQRQFLLEAVILSLAGGLLGVLGGIGGIYLSNTVGGMRAELVPASIPLAFGASAAIGIFFGYYPATKAAQLDPIEALRHE